MTSARFVMKLQMNKDGKRSLTAPRQLVVLVLLALTVSRAARGIGPVLTFRDSKSWTFFNGDWTDGPEATLGVSEAAQRRDGPAMQGHHYAFFKPTAYGDLHARFDIRLNSHTDAGLIFRAANP